MWLHESVWRRGKGSPHLPPPRAHLPSVLLTLCSTWASTCPDLPGGNTLCVGPPGRNWPLGSCCGGCVFSESSQPWESHHQVGLLGRLGLGGRSKALRFRCPLPGLAAILEQRLPFLSRTCHPPTQAYVC